MSENGRIIAVAGPTASGKTALAVELAKRFNGEVISCDSMQLYKGMNIGTAKPTEAEMKGVPHHLIDVFDIQESFSVSDYVSLATACADGLLKKGKLPIICGGTGLYLDSLIKGTDFGEYENSPGLREELYRKASEDGGAVLLHSELSRIDPEAAAQIHPSNVKRVVRAIEIYRSSGVTPTEQKRRSLLHGARYLSLIIGLRFSDREMLYGRINERVDVMLSQGLLQEAEELRKNGLFDTPTASAAIGYKELLPYFEGVESLEACVENIKRESRRYAKRQMTWFSRNPAIHWITLDGKSFEDIAEEAENIIIDEAFFPTA